MDGSIYFKHKDDLGWEPSQKTPGWLVEGYYISQRKYLEFLLTGSWTLDLSTLRSKD